jgi:hypothetical protein
METRSGREPVNRRLGSSGAAVLVAWSLLVAGLAACGGDDGTTQDRPVIQPVLRESGSAREVAQTVRTLQRAFVDRDPVGICRLTSKSAQKQAGKGAHSTVTTCPRDVREFFAAIRRGGGWREGSLPSVVAIDVEGDRATATVATDVSDRTDLPLVHEEGRWKLDAFFGTPVPQAKQVTEELREARFPAQRAAAVTVSEHDGRSCGELSDARYPVVSGGCRFRVRSTDAVFDVKTVFGEFKLADCRLSYHVLVDGAGRTWVDKLEIAGSPKVENACGDINSCWKMMTNSAGGRQAAYLPWKGRISGDGDGGFTHTVDVCMATCVGYFVGELRVPIRADGKEWRVDGARAAIGPSGLEMDSRMTVDATGLRLREAGSSS